MFARRAQLVSAVFDGYVAHSLGLMVSLSGLLGTEDYRRLGPLLWAKYLLGKDPQVLARVCRCLVVICRCSRCAR